MSDDGTPDPGEIERKRARIERYLSDSFRNIPAAKQPLDLRIVGVVDSQAFTMKTIGHLKWLIGDHAKELISKQRYRDVTDLFLMIRGALFGLGEVSPREADAIGVEAKNSGQQPRLPSDGPTWPVNAVG